MIATQLFAPSALTCLPCPRFASLCVRHRFSLHIEFEYNKSKYSLADVVIGKIYFLLVRIKVSWE